MPRPYQRLGAAELESLFQNFQQTNPSKLAELRDELLQRSTQKALDLLAKVDEAIVTIAPQSAVLKAEPHQLPLALPSDVGKATVSYKAPAQVSTPTRKTQEAPKAAAGQTQKQDALVVLNPMTTTDAANALGVAVGASWEVVERARQLLVTKSIAGPETPETDKTVARANLAYISLAKARCF